MSYVHDSGDEMCEFAQFQADITPSPEKIVHLSPHQLKLLSELQVEVSVEIGTLQLSLEEIIDIARGNVFAFAYDENRPVALKLGDECIALAQFVKKDEQLALQIISTADENLPEVSEPHISTRR